jgi:hypothetical protein
VLDAILSRAAYPSRRMMKRTNDSKSFLRDLFSSETSQKPTAAGIDSRPAVANQTISRAVAVEYPQPRQVEDTPLK